jgi:hypothetical protein
MGSSPISIRSRHPRRLSADFMLILLMMLCFVSKHFPNGNGDDQHDYLTALAARNLRMAQ